MVVALVGMRGAQKMYFQTIVDTGTSVKMFWNASIENARALEDAERAELVLDIARRYVTDVDFSLEPLPVDHVQSPYTLVPALKLASSGSRNHS